MIPEKLDDDAGILAEAYRAGNWFYIGPGDERRVWSQRLMAPTEVRPPTADAAFSDTSEPDLSISESERSFRKHFEAVTHRMIHRKASIEMFKRILNNSFGSFTFVSLFRISRSFASFAFEIRFI